MALCLNPPEHAVALRMDEKSQIPALERNQPILPMGLWYVEGVTHDYFRHGATLFTALDAAGGAVLTDSKPRSQPGVSCLSQTNRQKRPRGFGRPYHRRQLWSSQISQGVAMAGKASSIHDAFHAHLFLMA